MPTATSYSTEMALLTGNTGGAVQQLPAVSLVTGRKRGFVATIALASQAAGSIIGVARLPVGAVLTEIMLVTDTSLGSTTLAIGDTNNSTLYAAAQTLTTPDVPLRAGKTSAIGVQITTNLYDATTGVLNRSYEDVVLTTAVAALPSSGTLKVVAEYMID